MKIPGSGDKLKLFMIYTDQLIKFDYPFEKPLSSSMIFQPNQYNSSHELYWSRIYARAHYTHDLVLVPTLVDANDELINVALDKRTCKFDAEGDRDSRLFRMYTQESCNFECMANEALRFCGYCIPWNYPQVLRIKFATGSYLLSFFQLSLLIPDNMEARICDLFEAECVDNVFDNNTFRASECRDCYPGCKATILDYKQVKGEYF